MKITITILFVLLLKTSFVFGGSVDSSKINTILKNKSKEYNSLQIFKGDTLDRFDSLSTDDTGLPGAYQMKFTNEQDSAYNKALNLHLPIATRIWRDLILTDRNWELFMQQREKQPIYRIYEDLANIPKAYLNPDPKEVMQRDIAIRNSQQVPFVNTMPMYGAKIPFSAIGSLLGLTEDVSPNISYRLDKYTNVEVVIYSIRASVVAVLFKGNQPAGTHNLRWNGRDDNGKSLPSGDYIAEVRIGNERYIRKRIQIGI